MNSILSWRLGLRALILLALLLFVVFWWAPKGKAELRVSSEHYMIELEILAEGLQHPWSMVFLSDDEMLVTERTGQLRRILKGRLLEEPVAGVPEVAVVGQGGLLEVLAHPDFAENAWLYLSFAEETQEGLTTSVVRGRYASGVLSDLEPIFSARPASAGGRHFAGRMVFDHQGYLYIAIGDRGEMQRAQIGQDHAGKVVRLFEDGRIPPDNPFLGNAEFDDAIFTWGHRNPQGMLVHPETGEVWLSEHGPRGGDEINRLLAGANYGWPKVTHGIDYTGLPISQFTQLPGMQNPEWHWTPSIAPSGLIFYDQAEFPLWQGQFLSGALRERLISRLSVKASADEEGSLQEEERLLQGFAQRIRDLRLGRDGHIWLLTDEDPGQVVRLRRVEALE